VIFYALLLPHPPISPNTFPKIFASGIYLLSLKSLTLIYAFKNDDLIPDIMLTRHLRLHIGAMSIAVLITGCYGDLNITCEFPGPGCYDPDSINLYFFHSAEVNRPARGIAAFPDGGIPKSLFKKVSLCRFNTIQKSLVTIMDYGALPYSAGRWKFNLMIRNDSAAFMIEPVSGWVNELKWGMDSIIYLKYRFRYIYNIRSGELTTAESDIMPTEDIRPLAVSDLKALIKGLTYKDLGIDLDVISPAGKRERFKELSQLKGNQEYRDALIETLAYDLSEDEINSIISGITDYINSLDSYDRLLKKEYADKTIKGLEKIKSGNGRDRS
jgi:hypothetical protein